MGRNRRTPKQTNWIKHWNVLNVIKVISNYHKKDTIYLLEFYESWRVNQFIILIPKVCPCKQLFFFFKLSLKEIEFSRSYQRRKELSSFIFSNSICFRNYNVLSSAPGSRYRPFNFSLFCGEIRKLWRAENL